MHPFLRTRLCRAVSVITAFTLSMTTVLSTASVAYAAEAVSSPPPASVAERTVSAAPTEQTSTPVPVREVPGLGTETARYFEMSDGTRQAEFYAAPVRYREAGAWKDLDSTLVADPADPLAVTARSTPVKVHFGTDDGSKAPVRIEKGASRITMDLLGAREGAKIYEANRVRYLLVAPATDLTYETDGQGVKDTLVLASTAAPRSFTFFVGLTGLELSEQSDGTYSVLEAGRQVGRLGDIGVWDSAGGEGGEPVVCEDASMTVRPAPGGAYVTYSVSDSWIDDPARSFPVYVDPSVTFNYSSCSDTYAAKTYPTTNYGTQDHLKVGDTDGADNYNRAFVKFGISGIPSWATINSATYSAYIYHQYYSTGTYITYLARVTTSWSEGGVTWNAKPGYSAYDSQNVTGENKWVNWDVESLVEGWLAGTYANNGVMMYQLDTQSVAYHKIFYSSEWPTASLRPKLVVNYTADLDAAQASATTTESAWYNQPDANSDGVADAPNDTAAGRGSVNLAWDPVAHATSYKVYMLDGNAYRQVGTATQPSWSTAGKGLYPTDTRIASLPSQSASPAFLVQTPALATREATIAVPGATGAGVVVSDGTYLYVRAWAAYAGPTTWKKVGSGFGGTTAGTDYGNVGPSFSGQTIRSAFLADDKIYNGWAVTASSVTGVSKSTGATSTLAFKTSGGSAKPLLNCTNGADMTAAGNTLQLASDANRIYSVAYGRDATTYNGWRVREFTTAGTFVADHSFGSTSFYADGAYSDGAYLYFMEWGGTNRVTKVRLSDWSVVDTWESGWAAYRDVQGCWDATNNCFWTGALDLGRVYRYAGGLDLSDDPTPLYAKTAGTSVDGVPAYFFKVVPLEPLVEQPLSQAATMTVQLANRTKHANEDVAHTTYDLGSVAGDSAQAELDSGALTLASTDLAIDSYGPSAGLSRTYRSDVTSSTKFAAGWRFSFEQNIATGPVTSRTYTDEGGQSHRFIAAGTNTWAAPHPMIATLTYDTATSTYALAFKGGETLAFDSTGRLTRDTDRHGQYTSYSWNDTTGLSITAANGQTIAVTFAGIPARITGAAYTAGGLTRSASYISGATTSSVTRTLSANQSEQVDYGYVSIPAPRIVSASVKDFAPAGVPAVWGIAYDAAGKVQSVSAPHPASIADRTTAFALDAVNASATVSYPSRVWTASSDSTVTETYRWDPTGRQIAHTGAVSAGSSPDAPDTTDYAPSGEVRRSVTAAGVVTDSVTDVRGNELISSDVDGDATVNTYNATDDLVSSTSPLGSVTTSVYSAAGDVTLERRTLNATQSSETSSTYDAQGRALSEGSLISATGARAYTTYEYDLRFTTPVRTTLRGVALSSTSTVDLVSTSTLDDFGQVVSATDNAGQPISTTVFDLSGRAVSQTDATGTVTHYRYDVMGNDIETSRTAGAQWSDWTSKTVDPTGLVLTEQSFVTSGGAVVVQATTTHIYDGSGQEIKTAASDVGTATQAFDPDTDTSGQWAAGVSTNTAAAQITIGDSDGRPISEQSSSTATGTPQGQSLTSYEPGADEVATSTPVGEGATSFEYDEEGNQTAQTSPVSGGLDVTTYDVYDIGGRLVSSTDAEGDVVETAYDLADRVISTGLQGTGQGTATTYNTQGWVLSSTDAGGVVSTFTYDRNGHVTDQLQSKSGASSRLTHSNYDAMGNLVCTTNPDSSATKATYDKFGRVVGQVSVSASGTVTQNVSFTLDETGRTVSSRDTAANGVTTDFTFAASPSGLNVRTSRVADTTRTVTTDARGIETVSSLEVSGVVLTSEVLDRNDAQQPWWVLYTTPTGTDENLMLYDVAGRMYSAIPTQSKAHVVTRFGYDIDTGRKSSQELPIGGIGTSYAYYQYTEAGRLASVSGLQAFKSGEVTSTTTAYSFDAAGNIVSAGPKTLAYTGTRLTSSNVGATTTTYAFDTFGRRTSQASPDESATLTWDARADRLLTYTHRKRGAGDTTATLTYDGSGQRTRSVVTSGSVTTTTTFTYEGLQLFRLVATTPSKTTTLTYLYDDTGRASAVAAQISDDAKVYLARTSTTDRGDVLLLTDFDPSGDDAVLAGWSYDAWGNPLTTAAPTGGSTVPTSVALQIAAVQPLRYAGYAYDSFSGLYYCSQRYYDPATMQFISADPANADGEESAYQYCGGDPVGKADPSGLWGKGVHYDRTKKWAAELFEKAHYPGVPTWIAEGDEATDDGVYNNERHGYQGSEGEEAKQLRLAFTAWNRAGNRPKAARLLGRALHTMQDRFAHRRDWKGKGVWKAHYYDKKIHPKHTGHHDIWKEAYPSCQGLVTSGSLALLRRFKVGAR